MFSTSLLRFSFWMKNVSLPLDIGYFDSKGRLIEQHALYPHDDPYFQKATIFSSFLKWNAVGFQKNKLYSGEMLDIEKVRASVYLRQSKGDKKFSMNSIKDKKWIHWERRRSKKINSFNFIYISLLSALSPFSQFFKATYFGITMTKLRVPFILSSSRGNQYFLPLYFGMKIPSLTFLLF